MVQFLKRQWPVFLAFAAGMVMWMTYYIPTKQSQTIQDQFNHWISIIAACAFLLGLLSAIRFHLQKIQLKRPGFAYSYVALISCAVMTLAGLLPVHFPGFAMQHMDQGSLFKWLFDNSMVPMQATMFSILAFFIASAAFRAFRARSFEATALLVAGCILMVGRVPVGDWLAEHSGTIAGTPYHWLDLPRLSSWIFSVPTAAAQRGILLGVQLSQVAICVRIIFGIERTYMGGGD
jgi:hypothetical protein